MSSKEKIKQLLCDAICMLCQNTVEHNSQLSIEALIGITIDNGADIVLVSIKELLTKSNEMLNPAYGLKGEHDDESVSDTMQGYLYSEDESIPVDDECEDPTQSDLLQSHTIVKHEVNPGYSDKFIERKDGQHGSSSMGKRVQRAYHSGVSIQKPLKRHNEVAYLDQARSKKSFQDQDNCNFSSSNPELSHENLNLCTEEDPYRDGAFTSQTGNTAFGWHGLTKSVKNAPFRRKVKQSLNTTSTSSIHDRSLDSGEQKTPEDSEMAPEVTHMTLYRCTLCGATMSRLDSFKRHKRTHLGIACASCDICGKTFSRVDNMNSHRRRCAAYGTQIRTKEQFDID